MALVEAVYLTLALMLSAFFVLSIHMRRRYPDQSHMPWMIAGIGTMAATMIVAALGIDSTAIIVLMHVLLTVSAALVGQNFIVLTGSGRPRPVSLGIAIALTSGSCVAIIAGVSYIHATIPFHLAVSLLLGEAGLRAVRHAGKDRVNCVIAACLLAMATIFTLRSLGFQEFFDTSMAFRQIKQSRYEMVTVLAMAVPGITMTLLLIYRTLDQAAEHFRAISSTDSLTGLMNRSAFMNAATSANRQSWLIVCDIDNFKRVNDNWGHAAGDVALKSLGRLLRSMKLTTARFGGEEFAIFLPFATLEQSRLVAEGLRTAFSLQQIEGLPENMRLTASFGVAGWEDGDSFDTLFKRADAALYHAKAEGRDRVSVAPVSAELTAQDVMHAA
jgi:diguanylate cyclase (GGDEF)-like protein